MTTSRQDDRHGTIDLSVCYGCVDDDSCWAMDVLCKVWADRRCAAECQERRARCGGDRKLTSRWHDRLGGLVIFAAPVRAGISASHSMSLKPDHSPCLRDTFACERKKRKNELCCRPGQHGCPPTMPSAADCLYVCILFDKNQPQGDNGLQRSRCAMRYRRD